MDAQATPLNTELKERTDAQISDVLDGRELDGRRNYVEDQMRWLRDYAAGEGLGLKALALRAGMSTSSISQLYSGAYVGSYVGRAQAIERFRVDLEKRLIYGGCTGFVETKIARGLWRVFEQTRYNRRIQIIQSPEQLGKSRAAAEYAARNNGGRTIIVTLKPGGSSNPFGVFLRDLAQALHVSIDHQKIMDVRFAVRERLSVCDLIILDEFHLVEHWPEKAVRDLLDFLRIELHADGARGIVLIATNSDVMTLIHAFRRRAKYNVGQLLGRMCNEVRELDPTEIPFEDVEGLTARYFKAHKPTLQKLYDLATRPRLGHFGLILDVLNRCWADSKLDKVPMTDELVIRKIAETLEDLQGRKALYE